MVARIIRGVHVAVGQVMHLRIIIVVLVARSVTSFVDASGGIRLGPTHRHRVEKAAARRL